LWRAPELAAYVPVLRIERALQRAERLPVDQDRRGDRQGVDGIDVVGELRPRAAVERGAVDLGELVVHHLLGVCGRRIRRGRSRRGWRLWRWWWRRRWWRPGTGKRRDELVEQDVSG